MENEMNTGLMDTDQEFSGLQGEEVILNPLLRKMKQNGLLPAEVQALSCAKCQLGIWQISQKEQGTTPLKVYCKLMHRHVEEALLECEGRVSLLR